MTRLSGPDRSEEKQPLRYGGKLLLAPRVHRLGTMLARPLARARSRRPVPRARAVRRPSAAAGLAARRGARGVPGRAGAPVVERRSPHLDPGRGRRTPPARTRERVGASSAPDAAGQSGRGCRRCRCRSALAGTPEASRGLDPEHQGRVSETGSCRARSDGDQVRGGSGRCGFHIGRLARCRQPSARGPDPCIFERSSGLAAGPRSLDHAAGLYRRSADLPPTPGCGNGAGGERRQPRAGRRAADSGCRRAACSPRGSPTHPTRPS